MWVELVMMPYTSPYPMAAEARAGAGAGSQAGEGPGHPLPPLFPCMHRVGGREGGQVDVAKAGGASPASQVGRRGRGWCRSMGPTRRRLADKGGPAVSRWKCREHGGGDVVWRGPPGPPPCLPYIK